MEPGKTRGRLILQLRLLPIAFLIYAICGIIFYESFFSLLLIYIVPAIYLTILLYLNEQFKFLITYILMVTLLMAYLFIFIKTSLSSVIVFLMLNVGSAFISFYSTLKDRSR